MDDLHYLATVLQGLLNGDAWQPQEARALLRAGRALAREKGCPGLFDHLLADNNPRQPTVA